MTVAHLITGDAVTLELRIAGLPSRMLALTIDLVVQILLLAVTMVFVGWAFSAGGSPGAASAVTLAAVVLVVVGWPTLVETLSHGRSLGKAVMGLRVVRDDGGPVRMRHALVRALAMVVPDLWITSGVVGGLSALMSARSKRIGDHLAGTIVVGERVPRTAYQHQQAILMPPPLAAWAAGLDLVAVPDSVALNARTFLQRAPSLDPAARHGIASRLATQMSAFVRTPAPLGTPAEAYLAAVLAERTRRSWAAGPAGAWGVSRGPAIPGGAAPGPVTGSVPPPPRAAPPNPAGEPPQGPPLAGPPRGFAPPS